MNREDMIKLRGEKTVEDITRRLIAVNLRGYIKYYEQLNTTSVISTVIRTVISTVISTVIRTVISTVIRTVIRTVISTVIRTVISTVIRTVQETR